MNEHSLPAAAASDAAAKASRRRLPKVDFLRPAGAPALFAPDSLHWQVFKNPVSLFVGGITAVLLDLAEERVRAGVWMHSIFRTDPLMRMRRTGLVAHASVYAPQATAEKLIAGVVHMHSRVEGRTPRGTPYHASDPQLLNWVQCTVSFGFMEAYTAFCRPLSGEERDRFYVESQTSARLFLATGAPRSLAEQRAQFEAMKPHLEPHPIVFEFLDIVTKTPAVPPPLRPLQRMMIRAAIQTLPQWVVERLRLSGDEWRLKPWERKLIERMGALFERVPIPFSPPTLACQRMGLPMSYLYGRPSADG